MSELLVITGATGVGKTSVAWEITEVLEERGEAFGFFDPDAVHFRPIRDEDDPFGYRVSLAALDAAWPLMGADRLVMPIVLEHRDGLGHFAGWDVTVARLTAPLPVIEERLRRREIGAALQWHIDRAAELERGWAARPVEDVLIDTDGRSVREIATDVLARVGWI